MLLKHRSYDCSINLLESTHSPFRPIDDLFQNELIALQKYLNENLAKNFIRHSKSLTGTPILFIKKKDSSLRICVNYHGLNKITIKNQYPLLLISRFLDQLGQVKVYTKIDLPGVYKFICIKRGDE